MSARETPGRGRCAAEPEGPASCCLHGYTVRLRGSPPPNAVRMSSPRHDQEGATLAALVLAKEVSVAAVAQVLRHRRMQHPPLGRALVGRAVRVVASASDDPDLLVTAERIGQ